jgi:molybdopterin/thiamine biosynthesis adenylyltransferase
VDINYSRQSNIFNKDEWNAKGVPIHIIGVGATGSWLTLMLAKMGIKNITVWDFDVVESHNLPNQAFEMVHVGVNKARALRDIVNRQTGNVITMKEEKVTGATRLTGVVFVLTDTMKSREYIFKALKFKPAVKLVIETRMSGEGGYVYTFNPLTTKEVEKYEKTLYSDEEAETSACGTSVSIVSTAINIASQAVWRFINYANDNENPFFSAIGLGHSVIYNEEV